MPDNFDAKEAAKNIEQLANKAGDDWVHSPAAYSSDAVKLSQAVSMLAQQEHLEDTLSQMQKDTPIFHSSGCAPSITMIERNGDGRISGIKFESYESGGWMDGEMMENPSYATVTYRSDKSK